MGSTYSEPPKDYRIDKNKKLFDLHDDQIFELWKLFCDLDRENKQHVKVEDYFSKFLQIKTNILTESMLSLIDTKKMESITFGEFVDLNCTFAGFEQLDLIKFCFFTLDCERVGSADKNEIRHFVYEIWDHSLTSNIHQGLEYLTLHDRGDGRFKLEDIIEMHNGCPAIFYPAFRIQVSIMRRCFGETWWDWKKNQLADTKEDRRSNAANKLKKEQEEKLKAKEVENDDVVKKRMGIKYYIFPCFRKRERERVARIAAITAELDKS